MAVYFQGRRRMGSFLLALNDRKATLNCEIFERWEDIDCSTTARCGADGQCEVSKTLGISEKTARTLEDVVESSIGIKGFAELKAQAKDIIGKEVNWSQSTTTTKTFPYKAPKCGRFTLIIYQLVREFELSYHRPRLLGADEIWDRVIREDTNTHDALPDVLEFDNYPAGVRGFDRGFSITLPVDIVPAPLRFLSGIDGETIEAHVSRFKEAGEKLVFDQLKSPPSIVELPEIFIQQDASYLESDS